MKPEERELGARVDGMSSVDPDAFGRIWETYNTAIVNHIYAQMRSGSRSDAEDIAQNVYVDALKDLGKPVSNGGYNPARASYYTYLMNRFAQFHIMRWNAECLKAPIQVPIAEERIGSKTHDDKAESDQWPSSPERFVEMQEEAEQQLAKRNELYHWLLKCGGYPHEQLAFGFSKLIYEGKDRVQRLHREHAETRLSSLAGSFLVECVFPAGTPFCDLPLEDHIKPLQRRLETKMGHLFRYGGALKRRLADSHKENEIVENTELADYYTARGYSGSIPDWINNVMNKIQEIMVSGHFGCNACKLRHACAQPVEPIR